MDSLHGAIRHFCQPMTLGFTGGAETRQGPREKYPEEVRGLVEENLRLTEELQKKDSFV